MTAKKILLLVGVVLVVVAATLGVGYWLGRRAIAAARDEAEAARLERDRARADLSRARVPLELCRAGIEIGRANYGNAAERLNAARDAARGVPELRVLEAHFEEAIESARRLDPATQKRIDALLADTAK